MVKPAFPADLPDDPPRGAPSDLGDLLRRDRHANVGALAAGIANEVHAPVAHVAGGLEALKERIRGGGTLGEESLSLVADMLEAARRADAFLRDLRALTAAPREGATPELPEVVHAAARIGTTMIGAHGARLVVGPVPAVPAGNVLVGQLALWLGLAALREARAEARVDAVRDERELALVARHDGPPSHDGAGKHDRAVCAAIVGLLGGKLDEDEGGAGLRATVPLSRLVPLDAEPTPVWPAPRGRVLVIDDDAAVAEVLAIRLEQSWSVDVCTDPVRALSLLRGAGAWDAVVCDVRMEPLSGPELYRQLCADLPAWRDRFVFVSAGVPCPDEVSIIRAGGCPLLSKPNTLHRLLDAVAGRVTRSAAPIAPV